MKVINTAVTPALIKKMFGSDEELLTKYHIEAGKGINRIVSRTVRDLKQTDTSFLFYVVKDGKKEVGFFGTENKIVDGFEVNYLTTIFVHPKYRTKECMSAFWQCVVDKFGDKVFFSGLYEKNTRAIDFYKRNGGQVAGKLVLNEQPIVIIYFDRKEQLCQSV